MSEFNGKKLRQFISESKNAEADLIFQRIIDNIDDGHVEYSPNYIEVHIGRLVKKSKYNVVLVIESGSKEDVKLGKKKSTGEYIIYVTTDKDFPKRKTIDDFLSYNTKIADQIKRNLQTYLEKFHDDDNNDHAKTKYEEERDLNDRDNFEEKYRELVAKLDKRVRNFKETVENLKKDMETANVGKREAVRLAMKKTVKETFGENANEFVKIAVKLGSSNKEGQESDLFNSLDKENKDKLKSRLENYYDQKIKPLLGR